ncbi:O-glucosyltransferase rumi homolog [Impatiens glandulifera]|uniref:O-glucosyltransferase rumi homolog n=1 Tax=Impatiens glandulifera TaxID=253017 RepID=UPI001FB0C0DC|nr:O-glucosyltransferase rumi homolog [Impatiens glandulifera]
MQGFPRYLLDGSGVYRRFKDTISFPLLRTKSPSRSSLLFILFLLFFLGTFIATRLLDSAVPSIAGNAHSNTILAVTPIQTNLEKKRVPQRIEIPLNCSSANNTNANQRLTCPASYYPSPGTFVPEGDDQAGSIPEGCPDYFRWIHEDLRPWKETGISKEMVERARRTANFRLVIVNGRAYVETFEKSFQTRDTFTLWGILQLLRKYPGKLPDLDLMFDCVDWPVVIAKHFRGPNSTAPPPLFRYCADDATLDIVFPDWSFWGWPEVNIRPWERLLEELKEGNKRKRWMERDPYAFWKGNPNVAETRMDLLKCNVSENQDWGARIYAQNWIEESRHDFNQSSLGGQCLHRYKIYIEGSAWSVSEKYILACDSVTLLVKPRYYDFFTRNLMPVHHYWPVKENDKCKSIKFAVEWGNSHKQKAQAIGKEASDFIQEDLKMDLVYDYMFHLLNEYAKLLKYKPTIPDKAVELCSETMACSAEGREKKFMMESLVKGFDPNARPCTMPPPYDRLALSKLKRRQSNSIKQVDLWEKKYWDKSK